MWPMGVGCTQFKSASFMQGAKFQKSPDWDFCLTHRQDYPRVGFVLVRGRILSALVGCICESDDGTIRVIKIALWDFSQNFTPREQLSYYLFFSSRVERMIWKFGGKKLRSPCTACWRCGAAVVIGKRCLRCSAQN